MRVALQGFSRYPSNFPGFIVICWAIKFVFSWVFLFPLLLIYFLAPICRAYRYLMSSTSSHMGLRFLSTLSHPRKNLLMGFSSLSPTTAIAKMRTIRTAPSCRWVGCQLNSNDSSSKRSQLGTVYSTNSNGKFSNKQFISVDPRLYEYILSNVREPEV